MEGIVELLLEVKIVEGCRMRLRIVCPGQAKSCLSVESGNRGFLTTGGFPLGMVFSARKARACEKNHKRFFDSSAVVF